MCSSGSSTALSSGRYPASVACAGGKYAVVAHHVEPRRRNQRGQLLDQFERFEDDRFGAVAPAAFEPVEQASVAHARQPLAGQRRPGGVATQALDLVSGVSGQRDVGVDAHPGHAGAATSVLFRLGVLFGCRAHTQHMLSGARPHRDPSADRGCGQLGEQRLLDSQRVGQGHWAGLVGAVIGRQASALEQTPQAAHRARGDAGDFLIARWRQRDELCRALLTAFVDPVEHERMKMDIQVECVAEALNERDRARLRFANCAQTSCAFSAGSEHALDEDP